MGTRMGGGGGGESSKFSLLVKEVEGGGHNQIIGNCRGGGTIR